ncbi:hypothetical protein LTR94_029466, partial [Friedmanniomyces endolithicus]
MGYLLVLFFLLYLLIAKVFGPRIRRVMDERRDTITGAVATARQVQAEAAEQAAQAQAELAKARSDARATAAAAKARVTEEANARQAAEEAVVNARIAEAEAAIAKTRDAAMGSVSSIASDAAAAMVERLTGKSATKAELDAVKGAGIWSLSNPEIWVGIGLLIFFGILAVVGVPKMVAAQLDAKGAKIQADLDEAARLRAEAEALLAQIRKEKAEAEAQAAEMMAQAEADARRLEAESKAKLEETLA